MVLQWYGCAWIAAAITCFDSASPGSFSPRSYSLRTTVISGRRSSSRIFPRRRRSALIFIVVSSWSAGSVSYIVIRSHQVVMLEVEKSPPASYRTSWMVRPVAPLRP